MKKIILVSRCAKTLYRFRAGLIRKLKSSGYNVIGVGGGGDGFETKVLSLGIPFVALPLNKKGINPLSDLKLFWALYRCYRKEQPDIVHHFTIKPVIYGSIAARLAGVPKIINTITGLGYVFTDPRRFFLRRLVEQLYRFSLKCAHFTFFQNRDDLQLFQERRLIGPKKAGLLRGSGVDLSLFAPTSRPEGQNPEKILTFLMIARLLRDKGVYEFVEAAREMHRSYSGLSFQLLGSVDLRNPAVIAEKEVKRWAEQGTIDWLGEVEDVRPYIANADVVVLPSYREGTPRSLLEAAAMAKPLIATDVAGCREVVEDGVNGFLVPAEDAEALAGAMRKMMADSKMRMQMGEAGRKKMISEFDETVVVQDILNIYNKPAGWQAGR